MSRILIAPDSFKESLSATQVCKAIAEGLQSINPDVHLDQLPFSDGGEGAFELFEALQLGNTIEFQVCDPLGRPLNAAYYGFKDGSTAWIELSQASGIALLKDEEKNPMRTSTLGTGLQLKHALENGYQNIILGIGGSATNDVATGIFTALGGKLLDRNQNSVQACGAHLKAITDLDFDSLIPVIASAQITVACDVSNLLLGATGAATIYAPQKGATPAQVTALEQGAEHLAQIIQQKTGRTITSITGGGAAGGTSAGMFGFFNSKLEPGFELLSKQANLEERVKQADLIITGEGKTDNQSQYGKVPFKLAELARKHYKPLYLFAGSVQADLEVLTAAGITKAIAIKTETMSLEYAKSNAFALLKAAVAQHLNTEL